MTAGMNNTFSTSMVGNFADVGNAASGGSSGKGNGFTASQNKVLQFIKVIPQQVILNLDSYFIY